MQKIRKSVDQISSSRHMDEIKREEFEKVYKKERDHRVRIRMVAVRMARVLGMSAEETPVRLSPRPRSPCNELKVDTMESVGRVPVNA